MSLPSEPTTRRAATRMWLTGGISLAAFGLVLIALLPRSDQPADAALQSSVPTKTARPGSGSHRPGDRRPASPMQVRVWDVPADFTKYLELPPAPGEEDDPFGAMQRVTGPQEHYWYREAAQALNDHGVGFPPGAEARIDLATGKLEARNTPENLALIHEIITGLDNMEMFVLDKQLLQMPVAPPVRPARDRVRVQAISNKLKNIILPEVEFDSITTREAIAWIEERSRELDTSESNPSKKGLQFRFQPAPPDREPYDLEFGAPDPGEKHIRELRLRNVPIATVLQYMCDSASHRYRIDEDAVTIVALDRSHPRPILITQHWHVAPALVERLRSPPPASKMINPFGDNDPFAAPNPAEEAVIEANKTVRDHLRENGISFRDGAGCHYSGTNSTLTIINTDSNLELAAILFTELAVDLSRERAGH